MSCTPNYIVFFVYFIHFSFYSCIYLFSQYLNNFIVLLELYMVQTVESTEFLQIYTHFMMPEDNLLILIVTVTWMSILGFVSLSFHNLHDFIYITIKNTNITFINSHVLLLMPKIELKCSTSLISKPAIGHDSESFIVFHLAYNIFFRVIWHMI